MLVFAIGFSFEPGFSSISFFDLLDAFLENTFVEGFLLELRDRVNVLIEELAKSCLIFGEPDCEKSIVFFFDVLCSFFGGHNFTTLFTDVTKFTSFTWCM